MAPFTSGVSGNPKGRPPKAEQDRRVRMTVVISPETKKWIQTQSVLQSVSQGVVIDDIVRRIRARK